MSDSSVPVMILSERRDDVELFNKFLRDAGHPVRCIGITTLDVLEQMLEKQQPHLLVHFAVHHKASVREVAKLRQSLARMASLIVVAETADEDAIGNAMRDGAQDLVSFGNRDRLCAVFERELRSFRLERSLNDTLKSATQYKSQLASFMAGSTDAIAQVQEGIVVEANQAWADVFCDSDMDAALGPLMDFFAPNGQAALKGALMACLKNRWDGGSLKIDALTGAGGNLGVELRLAPSIHDGEPATRLSILRKSMPAPGPEPEEPDSRAVHEDPTTGFFNRRRFLQLLTDRLDQRPSGGARALVLIRPDKFSDVERQVGPILSEELLGQLAQLLRQLTKETDLAGRFGGTVFTIVVERGSLSDIEAWAENALSRIAEHLFEAAQRSLSLTCTFGIAEIGAGTDRVEDLIRHAERASQRGRRSGGNRVELEESSDESTQIKRIDALWVQQIKSALVDGRFRLAHLSIAGLNGQSERMFDTVLRMVDEQGDEVAASAFLDTAGRNSLLRPIDRWVVGASIAFCTQQSSDLVFVKLSHDSLLDPTFCDWIREQAQTANVKPRNLCLQISEKNAGQYQKQATATAQTLKGYGFGFAVENFGIGRDPLRVLNNIPMDYVKFDGSLMQTVAADFALQDKLRDLIANAERLQVKTIAAHVENANTMAVLFQLGVEYMQGHYLHEPDVVLEEVV